MERQAVTSSNIKTVGWEAGVDPPDRNGDVFGTLEVEFTSGSLYQFFAVPGLLAAQFLAAPSVGRFFSEHIRGRFASVRIA